MLKKVFLFLALIILLFPSGVSWARIGVGVGTGKIVVEEKLYPGIIYKLPPLTVINTGDEESEYEVDATYHQDQPEMRPARDWFIFRPEKFHLEPGEAKVVEIKLNLPVKTVPGDYFAYLEGRPIKRSKAGSATIGVAAAAKLYFTVAPANIFQGIYYKIVSLWTTYAPWTNVAAVVVAIVIVVVIVRKFFNVQLSVGRKEKLADDKPKDE